MTSSPAIPTLRSAQAADTDRMLALAVRDSMAGVYSPLIAQSPGLLRKQLYDAVVSGFYPFDLGDHIGMSRCFVFVADVAGQFAGFIIVAADPRRSAAGNVTVEAVMLSVVEGCRRQGIGQRLLDFALADVRRRGGVRIVRARCLMRTRATDALLSRNGFEAVGQEPSGVTVFERPG